MGGAANRTRQGDSRPGVVRDVAAVGAEIQQCPAFVRETTASQVQLTRFKVGSFPNKCFHHCYTQSFLFWQPCLQALQQMCVLVFPPKQQRYSTLENCERNYEFKD